MFSKNSHAYRAHAHTVRVKDLLFYLYYLYVYVFGQWTVMDSSFLKSLTGTARTCGTRDKFLNFTVHYCPLSKKTEYKWVGVGGGCFQEYSRVPRARSTHNKFLFYPPPTPTLLFHRGEGTPQHQDDLVIYTKKLNSLSARACSLATEGTQEPSPVSFLYRM